MYLRVVLKSLAFSVGILLSASFLFFRLFKGMQEAKQARRLLRQEQELSDLVINDISNQGIIIFDEAFKCLLWNPGMEGLLGVKPADAVGRNLQALTPIFGRPGIGEALSLAVQGVSSVHEDESILPSGEERCLEINCFPVTMAEQKLGIAFIRDITEHWHARKQAQRANLDLEIKVLQRTAALQQAERRLIAAIETAPTDSPPSTETASFSSPTSRSGLRTRWPSGARRR
jgi:PAS domain S-box-containing protein